MSRLNLHCELCGRRQANGLLSGAAWAALEISPGLTLRACPSCVKSKPDWEEQLRALQLPAGAQAAPGLR